MFLKSDFTKWLKHLAQLRQNINKTCLDGDYYMIINRLVLYVAQMTFEVKLWLCDTILSGMNPWIAKLGHKIALILSHWRGVSGARLVELYKFIVYFSCIYHTLRWAAWVEMLTLYVLCKSVPQSSLEPTKRRTVKINSKKFLW